MMSDVDIIAAEHIIVSAQYKSKDWTDKYLVPVEQYRALEIKYRQLLWTTHFHTQRYGDDGELQCIQCTSFGSSDYLRDPLEKVEQTYWNALVARANGYKEKE